MPIIPDHAQIAMPGREELGQLILRVIGVLVLVDHDVRKLLLIASQDLGILAQQLHGLEDNVVKVERARLTQQPLVDGVHLRRRQLSATDRQLGVVLRPDQLILGAGDQTVNGCRLELLLVETATPHRFLDRRQRVGRVKDQKITRQSRFGVFTPQNPQTHRMIRPHKRKIASVGRVESQQLQHPPAHLAGGLIGKSNGQDAHRADATPSHQIGDAMRQGFGLTRTGAGQNQNRPFGRLGGQPLRLI